MDNCDFGPFSALGLERNGVLIGGVVFDGFYGPNVNAHIAGRSGTMWLTRRFLHAIFHYAFVQLGAIRMTGPVPSTNAASVKLVEHMGFLYEARLKDAVPDGDLLLYVMWKSTCRYLGERYVQT